MVKVKREYVFGAFVSTVLAVACSLASISTNYWVEATLHHTGAETKLSYVRYGLFYGIFRRGSIGSDLATYEITMTCLFGENACAVLCRDTPEQREQELQDLIDGKEVKEFDCNFEIRRMYRIPMPLNTYAKDVERVYINGGCYISTVLFLVLSIAMGAWSGVLLMWNVVGNPVQTAFSIYSLYCYVAIAAGLVLLPIIIWGTMFATNIVDNAAILMTLNGQLEYFGNPILHFSYWINFGAVAFYALSFGLLITRKHLMDTENTIITAINAGNPVIF